MNTLKIAIEKPILPSGSVYEHHSTSWVVSKIPLGFDDIRNLVNQSLDDVENLTEYIFNYELKDNEPLYFKSLVKFKHKTTGKIVSSEWSRVIPINSDQIGIKLSNTVVNTPIIKTKTIFDRSSEGEVEITTNNMTLYSGVGNHEATSWEVIDTDGDCIFRRYKDKDNLTNIKIASNTLKQDKIYIVKAKHHTNVNSASNYGKTIISTRSEENTLFKLSTPYSIMKLRWNYFNLDLYTDDFKELDMILLDNNGTIVKEELGQTSRTPRMYIGNLTPNVKYTLKARIKLDKNNLTTSYMHVETFILEDNYLTDFDTSLDYLALQSYEQNILTSGLTIQTSKQFYTNSILLGKHGDSKIYRYEIINGKLTEIEDVIDLGEDPKQLAKPYINIIPLHNGKVLLDYSASEINGDYKKSIFKVYEYNTIKQTFKYTHGYIRSNERYSTASSESTAVMLNNDVYYIPSLQLDAFDLQTNLELLLYNPEFNALKKVTNLPVDIKRFGSIVKLDEENLLFLGGVKEKIASEKEEVYNRSNDAIYKYNIKTNIWAQVGTLMGVVPSKVYNLKPFVRRDGSIVLFNGSQFGPEKGNQDTYVIDKDTYEVTKEVNDFSDILAYPTNIQLTNGEFLRVSARTLDPQKVYKYVSNTKTVDEIIDNDTLNIIEDLVIPVGETITIESPYRYNTIKIEGDSEDNTGKLRWIENDTLHEFIYSDLIVTRNTHIVQDLYKDSTPEGWTSITILDDVDFSVSNILEIPDDTDFSIQAPFAVDYLVIGENSALEVTTED